MFAHLRNRPEPELDRQPLALEHLRDAGRYIPKSVLSDEAFAALLIIASSRVRIVDAYTHGDPRPGHGGEWVIEVHGTYEWQECRFSPDQWQTFYSVHLRERYKAGTLDGDWWLTICRHLATEYPSGQLASTVDNVVAASRRARGEVA